MTDDEITALALRGYDFPDSLSEREIQELCMALMDNVEASPPLDIELN